jgi:hypothetical protein
MGHAPQMQRESPTRIEASGEKMKAINPENRRTEKMVDNFIEKHGEAIFKEFIQGLVNDESGGEWARRLGVSRERIRQWRNTFVKRIVYVSPVASVQERLRRVE